MHNIRVKLLYENVALKYRKYFVIVSKFLGVFFVLANNNLLKDFYKVAIFIATRYLSIILFFYLIFDYLMLHGKFDLLKLIGTLVIPMFLYFVTIPTRLNYFFYVLIIFFEFYAIF
jgi:hypothetical protein